jgi:hypothetical protein
MSGVGKPAIACPVCAASPDNNTKSERAAGKFHSGRILPESGHWHFTCLDSIDSGGLEALKKN